MIMKEFNLLFDDEVAKFFATFERIDGLKITFEGFTSSESAI